MSEPAIDRNSVTWGAIEKWVAAEIEVATTALTRRGLGPVETEFERGRIAALSSLLRLAAPEQKFTAETVIYDDFDLEED